MSSPRKRVALLFSGGPAPGANAVISAAASAFRRTGHDVVGIRHGYAALLEYDAAARPLAHDEDYQLITDRDLRGLRNTRGVFIGTSRANPGKSIRVLDDLDDQGKAERLRRVHQALVSLEVDALVSIGGDDTLRMANLLHEYQRRLPPGSPRVRIVHVPNGSAPAP